MTLAEEAQLYLAAVDVFRAEGCEPHWRSEWLIPPRMLGRSEPEAQTEPRRIFKQERSS